MQEEEFYKSHALLSIPFTWMRRLFKRSSSTNTESKPEEAPNIAVCSMDCPNAIPHDTTLHFAIHARLLRKLVHLLSPDPHEHIALITGIVVNDTRVATDIHYIKPESNSFAHAIGDSQATAKAFWEMHREGCEFLIMAHRHPGSHACSTHPSSTDMNYMVPLQDEHTPVIGIIVTANGFIRAFSPTYKFNLTVHGNGIKEIHHERSPHTRIFKIDLSLTHTSQGINAA